MKLALVTVLALLATLALVNAQTMFSNHGSTFKVLQASPCTDVASLTKVTVMKRKISRTTTAYFANFTIPIDLTEKVKVKALVSKWSDGGWKDNAMEMRFCHVCNILRVLKTYDSSNKVELQLIAVARYILDQLEPPLNYECPMPAGFYQLKNLTFDHFTLNSLAIFKGQFKAKVLWYREAPFNDCVICLETLLLFQDKLDYRK